MDMPPPSPYPPRHRLWDYGKAGRYFVTINTPQGRFPFFGGVNRGKSLLDFIEMENRRLPAAEVCYCSDGHEEQDCLETKRQKLTKNKWLQKEAQI
jgi:hypothetical protein